MATIQHKRGTAARWLEVDPVLAEGELGLETDTLKIKFGNGSSTWSALSYFTGGSGGAGTVTSVALTVPTGLTVSGSPVTTSGTLAIALDVGYSIPTTASQTNWDSAYTDRLKWDGGSTGLVAATGRTSLGATTVGSNLFTLTNPSAITFLKINADNTVSTESASTYRTSIGATTVGGNFFILTNPSAITFPKINADNTVTAESASTHRTSIGATTVGSNLFTLTNPSAITFLRVNADNTVSALDAATFRTAIGAGTSSTTGTVTTVSVASANGFAGTVANATTTPAITISTSITGLLSGNGTAISAATAGYGDTTNPYASKTANTFLAAPNGSSGSPTFRAIASADLAAGGSLGQILHLSLSGLTWGTFYIGATSVSTLSGGSLTLRQGTTSAGNAPLYLNTSSSVLTTPAAGAVENDAQVIYGTPAVGTATTGSTVTGRGLIPTTMMYVVNSDATIITASSATTSGNIMNGKGAWLLANTTYEVEFMWYTEVAHTSGSSALTNFNLLQNFPTGATGWLSVMYTSPSSNTNQSTTVAWQAVTDVAGTVTGGTATIQASSLVQVDGTLDISGVTTTVNGWSSNSNNGSKVTRLTGSGSVALGLNRLNITAANNDTFSGIISSSADDSAGLSIESGTQILTNINTYQGSTLLLGSTARLNLTGSGTIGELSSVGFVAASGGTFDISGVTSGITITDVGGGASNSSIILGSKTLTLGGPGSDFVTNNTFNGVVSGTGNIVIDMEDNTGVRCTNPSSCGSQSFSGTNTYTGTTTISAGTFIISGSGSLGSGSYSANITNNGLFKYSSSTNQTLSGIISGSGALTKDTNTSTLTLSNNNTYTGATTISAGTLTVSGTLADTTAVTVSSGATYNVNANDTIGSLAGAGTVSTTSTGVTRTLTSGGDNTSTTFSGVIQDNGTGLLALTKSGSGTLTLSGINTYTYVS